MQYYSLSLRPTAEAYFLNNDMSFCVSFDVFFPKSGTNILNEPPGFKTHEHEKFY